MMNKIRCIGWIDTDKVIWVISQDYNALLKIEKHTRTARAEIILEKYPVYGHGWYFSGVLSEDYIVCIPAAAKDIGIYSLNSGSIDYIPIECSKQGRREIYDPMFKFFGGYAYGGNVLIYGSTYPALISVNPKEKKIDYIDDWFADVEKYISEGNTRFYFGDGHTRVGNNLYIPMCICGAFLVVDLNTLQCRAILPPDKLDGIEGVTKIEDKLCFIGRKEGIYFLCLWNPGDDEMKKLRIPYQVKNIAWCSFLSPVFWKTKIYLLPYTADHFYVVDLSSEEIRIEKKLDLTIIGFSGMIQDIKVGAMKQDGNIVVFQTWWDYKWHKYNLDTWEYEDYELILDDEKYTQYYQKALCHKLIDEKIIISEKKIPVPIFLDEIKNMKQPYGECGASFGVEEEKWKTFLKTGN